MKVKRRAISTIRACGLTMEASAWFLGDPTPYMTTVHDVRSDSALVPAITHVDKLRVSKPSVPPMGCSVGLLTRSTRRPVYRWC